METPLEEKIPAETPKQAKSVLPKLAQNRLDNKLRKKKAHKRNLRRSNTKG